MAVGLEKRLERRASVLATARRLIAERGYTGVTIRDLARECGVTVGTLYNRFESKDKLLAAAIEELFHAHIAGIRQRGDCHGLQRVLAAAQIAVNSIEQDPQYSRAVVKGVGMLASTSELVQIISGGFHALYVQGLEEMREQGALANWANVHIIAETLADVVGDSNRRWANGNRSASWLRWRTLYGVSLTLCGVTCGAVQDELLSHLRGEQVAPIAEVLAAP